MVDFCKISTRSPKQGVVEIYPKFVVGKHSDLMIRGGDFYAVWIAERGLWSTDEQDALDIIDRSLDEAYEEYKNKADGTTTIKVLHMWDSDSGSIDRWHKYCQKQCRDSYHTLDEKLIFSNMETKKKDYASKRLEYPLEKGDCPSYERIMSTLYSPEERHKLEWAIGSIVSGDSKKIQKFLVLYGAAGTGKSTVLNIIQQLFEGYYSVFDARALGSSSNSFALEAFKSNPLVAIQHDGDLSRIEDNTRLNSLVSHELMTVNEKFKSTYSSRFKAFLFMGTNKAVKITDGKSGLIRRLIDVHPSGNKLSAKEYKQCMGMIDFELGAIAQHCLDVYLENPGMYDGYIPITMLGASNDFYNYIINMYHIFKEADGTTLKQAWESYNTYCQEAKVAYPYSQRNFKEELKNYFWNFDERYNLEGEGRVRSYYSGFRTDIFDLGEKKPAGKKDKNKTKLIEFLEPNDSCIFDTECADCPAQYASDEGTPVSKWANVRKKLKDIDTSKLHYVRVPENHIVIDFDIKDEDGNKSFEKNVEAASKWPATYAELSKSGAGVHLHYIYKGDVSKLSRVYDENIEVKVFTGNSSLRRKLSKCNNLPINPISSGLPLKGDKPVISKDVVQTEKGLRTTIKKCLNKEVHPGTKSNVDFIFKILEDAHKSGLHYDVSDMRNAIFAFAAGSTHQAEYCIKLTNQMKFKSDDISTGVDADRDTLVFYDVEVFPNLFLVNWKMQGKDNPVNRMINPTPDDIEDLLKFNLVGFNCRRYDNHILYARLMGYTNEQLYKLSTKIVNAPKGDGSKALFGEAYNISYTDVYDFCSTKQSLKKWEIELGIHHQELGLPWDQPVPEELWPKVAEYCDNDVIATEAVFEKRKADFVARQILVELVKSVHGINATVNDTTNSLSTKLIFGNNRNPQDQFNYRDMGDISAVSNGPIGYDEFTCFDSQNRPIFPGYTFDNGKSIYRDEEVGEGGYVYAEPGMHGNVALLDIASMHPSSAIAEQLFGSTYTDRFSDIVNTRVVIKHGDFDAARKMFGGALAPYLDDEDMADALSYALKIVVNSVYGLTSASFPNAFRDPRNIDNIVAKRGALFMINLKHEVQKRGYTVAHIKTDSIKIPDATPDIIEFVMNYGKMYGYNFEHEATYDRMCLVNNAVYIARYKDPKWCESYYGYKPTKQKSFDKWTPTGKQFAVPYVFKTLFSGESIELEDMCETIAVTKGDLYLDMHEKLPEGEHNYIFVGRVGSFCPILPGHGGGVLYRVADGKYFAPPGTLIAKNTPYHWLEAELVKNFNKEDSIDKSFYNKLVDDAVDTISEYGDFEWFTSNEPYIAIDEFINVPVDAPDEGVVIYETAKKAHS